MERIKCESFRFGCPDFADVFVRREAFEGLQPTGEVISFDEVFQVLAELLVAVVVEALDGRFLSLMVRFILSTCLFVQGCFGLVSR